MRRLTAEKEELVAQLSNQDSNIANLKTQLESASAQAQSASQLLQQAQEETRSANERATQLAQAQQATPVEVPVAVEPVAEEPMVVEEPKVVKQVAIGFSEELKTRMEENAEKLISDRKKNKAPEDYPSKKDLRTYGVRYGTSLQAPVLDMDQADSVMCLSHANGSQTFRVEEQEAGLFKNRPGIVKVIPGTN